MKSHGAIQSRSHRRLIATVKIQSSAVTSGHRRFTIESIDFLRHPTSNAFPCGHECSVEFIFGDSWTWTFVIKITACVDLVILILFVEILHFQQLSIY